MTEYSDNLTEEDVDAVLQSLPDHAITCDEIAMIINVGDGWAAQIARAALAAMEADHD